MERESQEEQNGANFSFVAPSCEGAKKQYHRVRDHHNHYAIHYSYSTINSDSC